MSCLKCIVYASINPQFICYFPRQAAAICKQDFVEKLVQFSGAGCSNHYWPINFFKRINPEVLSRLSTKFIDILLYNFLKFIQQKYLHLTFNKAFANKSYFQQMATDRSTLYIFNIYTLPQHTKRFKISKKKC